MEFITIESHFGVPDNLIRPNTRNRCSKDFVEIISGIGKILYPDEEIEIYLLPSEIGCYKDIIKVINKNAGILWVLSLIFTGISYIDNHQDHIHTEKMEVVEDTAKCLALKEQIAKLSTNYKLDNIPDDKINEICWDITLTKLKNDKYQTLQNDDMIENEETVLKDSGENILFKKKVEKKDFQKYIEILPENEDYQKDNLEWIIELIALVVKQKKEWKGIAWKGIYYWEDVKERGVDILLNGDEISFYMQDPDFKNKIDEHKITFSSGDNMRVLFTIKWSLKIEQIQNKSIYVKEVKKFNEDIINHIPVPKKKKEILIYKQQSLFKDI